MAEKIKSTPRPPETDGVSGRTFAKVRGRFNKSLVNRKTTRGKRAGRWRAVVWPHLHIDDGSMGGGGPIPHKDKITGEEPYRDNPTYHSIERHHIFHYCVFCHELTTGSLGEGWPGGLSFVIADKTCKDQWGDDTDQIVKDFMHELGHNILGGGRADYGTHRDNDGHHNTNTNCVMCTTEAGGTGLYYCSDCWDDIDLEQCDSNYAGGW